MGKALRMLRITVSDWPEHEVIHGDEWLNIYLKGKSPEFPSMFDGVDAVVDQPTAFWYQEIYEAFPDAKVILTFRDNEDVWLKSWLKQKDLDENLNGSGFMTKMLIKWCFHRTFCAMVDAIDTATYETLSQKPTALIKKIEVS